MCESSQPTALHRRRGWAPLEPVLCALLLALCCLVAPRGQCANARLGTAHHQALRSPRPPLQPATLRLLQSFTRSAARALRAGARQGPGAYREPCTPGSGLGYPTYTPTRRWPADAAAATGAVVLAVGTPALPFGRVAGAWASWREHFLPVVANSTLLVLVLSEQHHPSAAPLVEALGLEPLECGGPLARACHIAGALDSGYALHTVPHAGGGEALVAVSVRRFAAPYWVGRDNATEAGLAAAGWSPEHCRPSSYDYVKYTTWYAYALFRLQVLDGVDFWYKVDDDVAFHKAFPFDLSALMAEGRHMLFHTALTREPADCVGNVAAAAALWLDAASDACGRALAPRSPDSPWFTEDSLAFYSNFLGGWVGFWTSAEFLGYARLFIHFPEGAYHHRWGDQQMWSKAVAMFHTQDRVRDLQFLRREAYFSHP